MSDRVVTTPKDLAGLWRIATRDQPRPPPELKRKLNGMAVKDGGRVRSAAMAPSMPRGKR